MADLGITVAITILDIITTRDPPITIAHITIDPTTIAIITIITIITGITAGIIGRIGNAVEPRQGRLDSVSR